MSGFARSAARGRHPAAHRLASGNGSLIGKLRAIPDCFSPSARDCSKRAALTLQGSPQPTHYAGESTGPRRVTPKEIITKLVDFVLMRSG